MPHSSISANWLNFAGLGGRSYLQFLGDLSKQPPPEPGMEINAIPATFLLYYFISVQLHRKISGTSTRHYRALPFSSQHLMFSDPQPLISRSCKKEPFSKVSTSADSWAHFRCQSGDVCHIFVVFLSNTHATICKLISPLFAPMCFDGAASFIQLLRT